MDLTETPLGGCTRVISARQSSLRSVNTNNSSSVWCFQRQMQPQVTVKEVFRVPKLWHSLVSSAHYCVSLSFVLRRRVNMAESERSVAVKHCVLCQGECCVFFPSVLQRAALCQRWAQWKEVVGPPPQLGRRLPPLRALRQNAPGSTRRGLKALSLVHCLQVALGFLATRFDCWSLHAERREHKGACIPQLMYNIMARCGKQRWLRMWGPVWFFRKAYYRQQIDVFFYVLFHSQGRFFLSSGLKSQGCFVFTQDFLH